MEYERGSKEFKDLVALSKLKTIRTLERQKRTIFFYRIMPVQEITGILN
jgi:hypothetical protein